MVGIPAKSVGDRSQRFGVVDRRKVHPRKFLATRFRALSMQQISNGKDPSPDKPGQWDRVVVQKIDCDNLVRAEVKRLTQREVAGCSAVDEPAPIRSYRG